MKGSRVEPVEPEPGGGEGMRKVSGDSLFSLLLTPNRKMTKGEVYVSATSLTRGVE